MWVRLPPAPRDSSDQYASQTRHAGQNPFGSKRAAQLPWWGHALLLALILGGTGLSIATGNPLYAVGFVVTAWIIGSWLGRTGRPVGRGTELGVTAAVAGLAIVAGLVLTVLETPSSYLAPSGNPIVLSR